MNNLGNMNNEINFGNKRNVQPRISMPQINFNASMMQPQNYDQFNASYMTNNPGQYANQMGNMPGRNIPLSSRNLGTLRTNDLGNTFGQNLNNYKSTTNFGNTFTPGNASPFTGNQTSRYQPDYFNGKEDSSKSKKKLKSKSQKRKLKKKNSKIGKSTKSKTKSQALHSLEVKFGALLNELKEDTIVDMNMENASITDNEVRALGSILSVSKKLRKLSFKRNNITDRGVKHLCSSLSSSNLEFLDLSYNRISPISFGEFKKYKLKNKKIRCIILRNNDIPSSIKRKRNIEFQKIGLNFDF